MHAVDTSQMSIFLNNKKNLKVNHLLMLFYYFDSRLRLADGLKLIPSTQSRLLQTWHTFNFEELVDVQDDEAE